MATSLDVILGALQNGVEALNRAVGVGSSISQAVRDLNVTLSSAFPVVSATSTSANPGGATLTSSQPEIFLTVTTSSGGQYKIAGYNP